MTYEYKANEGSSNELKTNYRFIYEVTVTLLIKSNKRAGEIGEMISQRAFTIDGVEDVLLVNNTVKTL